MAHYPIPPYEPKANRPWLISLVFVVLLAALAAMAYSAANTRTELVTTGIPMEIVRGHLEAVETRSIGTIGILERSQNDRIRTVVLDSGEQVMQISAYGSPWNLNDFTNEGSHCIYLQERLSKTVYFGSRVSYRQYMTFEGIREASADGSCPDFPVD